MVITENVYCIIAAKRKLFDINVYACQHLDILQNGIYLLNRNGRSCAKNTYCKHLSVL